MEKNKPKTQVEKPKPFFGIRSIEYFRLLEGKEISVSILPTADKMMVGILVAHDQFDLVLKVGEALVLIPKHSIRFVMPKKSGT